MVASLNNTTIIILLILLILYFTCACRNNKQEPFVGKQLKPMTSHFNNNRVLAPDSDWTITQDDMNPSQRLKDVVNEYGVPSYFDGRAKGIAIWDKEHLMRHGRCLERIELRDEMIPHNSPAPHFDFLYAWFKINIPSNMRPAILSLSESIAYDAEKQMVRTRCHFMGANMATLLLVKRVVNGDMTLAEAREQYGPYIFATLSSHESYDRSRKSAYEKELCEYYNEQILKSRKGL